MDDSENLPKYSFHLEPFGQQPGLWNLYTQLTFCYDWTSGTTQKQVNETLQNGLKQLTNGFPWVAGQITKTVDPKKERADYYMIEAFESTPKFAVKDLRHVLPGFDTYKASDFPISLLDESVIAPRNTKSAADELHPKPVFLLQATFVTGGLLLTFVAQHGTMDMVGQGEIIKLLSKACNDVAFTEDELSLGNRDRCTMVPLLYESEEQSKREDAEQTVDDVGASHAGQSDVENISQPPLAISSQTTNAWAYFSFSSSSLQALKAFAIQSTTLTSEFISTDDALSAFIWQCVTKARMPRYGSATNSTFARTVDMRRYLDVAPTYPGNLANKSFTTLTFQQLYQEPLGAVASLLRQSIDPRTSNLAHNTRAAATVLSRPVRKQNSSSRSRDLSRDIAFSSWAKLDYCYDLDFGLGLGKPAAVRRPAFAPAGEQPMEGVVYLMPKRWDGEIAVVLCLRDDDMNRLREDETWRRYAEYVG